MSVERESIVDILSGKEPPATVTDVKPVETPAAAPSAAPTETPKEAPKAEVTETKPAETAEAKARDDKGRFQKAADDKKPEPMVPLSALLAERAKRKEPDGPPKPKTSFLENEDQAFTERVSEHVNPVKEALFEMSVELLRESKPDFDEVATAFSQAADNDPRLWEQMRAAKNPAKYVYGVGTQIKELAQHGGDVIKYRDAAVAGTKAELAKANERISALEAEIAGKAKAKDTLDNLPRSLNSAPSGQPAASDAAEESIRNIVRFGNKST